MTDDRPNTNKKRTAVGRSTSEKAPNILELENSDVESTETYILYVGALLYRNALYNNDTYANIELILSLKHNI